jgi:hypothetical protein
VVFCTHPENIFKSLYRTFHDSMVEKENINDSIVWRQMNYPHPLQGYVLYTERAKKRKAPAVPVPVPHAIWIPRAIQKLAKDWAVGWGRHKSKRRSYMGGLLHTERSYVVRQEESKDDRAQSRRWGGDPLGLTVHKADYNELYTRSDACKLYAYRYGHTASPSTSLTRIISRYRDQVCIGSRIVSISSQDETALRAYREEDLLTYRGGVHVRDLALMLEALLYLYHPLGMFVCLYVYMCICIYVYIGGTLYTLYTVWVIHIMYILTPPPLLCHTSTLRVTPNLPSDKVLPDLLR